MCFRLSSSFHRCKLNFQCFVQPFKYFNVYQVFIEEADLQTEADKEAGNPPILLGESFMMANLSKRFNFE